MKAKCEKCGEFRELAHYGKSVAEKTDRTARPAEWLCQECVDRFIAKVDAAIAALEKSLEKGD